ncbi:hypothetical protein Tco_1367207 [Tanacetum coccineum]
MEVSREGYLEVATERLDMNITYSQCLKVNTYFVFTIDESVSGALGHEIGLSFSCRFVCCTKFTAKNRVKDSKWFKDKMLLTQAQEAGVVLNEEQQDLLADSLEEINDCEDLQLQATTNFKANHVDAYDSDYDDEATANAIFIANLSPVGSINDDMVEPCYDSDMLSKVPHYDTYHDSDMLNSNVQKNDMMFKFDEWIKRRTTLSPHQIGSWEKSNIKGAFKKDVIPFSENLKETFKLFEKGFIAEVKEMKDIFEQMEDEVEQCSVAKKCFEIEKKQLLINNDRLLEENISCDIMCTYLRSLNEVDNCGKCKSLDIVLLDLQESNNSLCELRKC